MIANLHIESIPMACNVAFLQKQHNNVSTHILFYNGIFHRDSAYIFIGNKHLMMLLPLKVQICN